MSRNAAAFVGADHARLDRLSRLREERDFLLASIADLEAERAAGDVEEADFDQLRRGYVSRAAEAIRQISELEQAVADAAVTDGVAAGAGVGDTAAVGDTAVAGAAVGDLAGVVGVALDEEAPAGGFASFRRYLGRRRTRRLLAAVGVICVLGLVGIAAAHFAGVRLPGQPSSGTTGLPTAAAVTEELAQASQLAGEGQLTSALSIYDEILATSPRQPEALTYRGWLLRLSGIAGKSKLLVSKGDAELATVAAESPGYANGRALFGVALAEDLGELRPAVVQFRAALDDGASTALLKVVGAEMARGFVQDHQKVPARLAPYLASTAAS